MYRRDGEELPHPHSSVNRSSNSEVRPRAKPRPVAVKVSCVIPTLNEAQNIGWVLARLPKCVDEVILVDGDSVDETVAVARAVRKDMRVLRQQRPGKGSAIRVGLQAARGNVVVMIDADGSMDPGEIPRFLDLMDAGSDLVKGSRFLGRGGTTDMEWYRRWGNAALRHIVNLLYGRAFSDLCYGYMALRRARLQELALKADGFEIETEIIVRASLADWKIAEVPSFESKRRSGDSNLRCWRDGRRVLRTLLHHRFTPEPVPQRETLVAAPFATLETTSGPATERRRSHDRRQGRERRLAHDRRLASDRRFAPDRRQAHDRRQAPDRRQVPLKQSAWPST